MADTTINFSPAKFASGVAKSVSSAMTQTLSIYMPFTSELISDASDAAFNVKSFIAENRPDKANRNQSSIIRTFTTKTANASKTLLSDLSHGDLSLSRTREGMIKYLKKNIKSDSDFDFDFDFDDDDNENMPEAEAFTAEDYAQGVYESTMATVGAIEVSTNKLALTNAKSNNLLADRLIANNMANMAQTMQMLETINSNVSGVNTNLASLVEYNNTTMNDFIKATTTHFVKVEKFMETMTKHFGEEDKKKKTEESNEIFKNNRIQPKALINRAAEIAGENGMFSLSTMLSELGSRKKLDISGIVDTIKNFDPTELLIRAFLPELGGLERVDKQVENMFSVLKYKLTHDKNTGGFFDRNNPVGKILLQLFGKPDDFKLFDYFKDKNTQWKTSDSQALQLIPSTLNEVNENITNIGINVENIVGILKNIEANGMGLVATQTRATNAITKRIFDSSTGKLENANKRVESGKYDLMNARLSSAADISNFIYDLLSEHGNITVDSATTDKINAQLTGYLVDLFSNRIDVDANGSFNYGKIKNRINRIIESSGDAHLIDDTNAADFMSVLMKAEENRTKRTDAAINRLSTDENFKRAMQAKYGKFTPYDLLEQDFLNDYMQSDHAKRYIEYTTQVADQLARTQDFIRATYINEPLANHEFEVGDEAYKAALKRADKAVKRAEDEHRARNAGSMLSNKFASNKLNYLIRALSDTITGNIIDPISNYVISGNKESLNKLTPSEIGGAFRDSYVNRQHGAQVAYENGIRKTRYLYSRNSWGKRFVVDTDGNITEEEDPKYTEVKEHNASTDNGGPYVEDPKTHQWSKVIVDENGKEQTIMSPHQYTQPTFATGATRINADQIAKIHEGEMILDRSLSQKVRDDIVTMLNNGGYNKMSKEQQDSLIKAIGDSDERFKGHEEDVIKAINRVVDQYDLKKIENIAVNPSEKSICFIDVDEEDTFSSVLAKKITEIAVNLGIVAQSTINDTAKENEIDNKSKFGKGRDLLTGTKNESGMYVGGFFSNEINRVKDEVNYRRFKYLDGKEYTGYTRDENGKIIEGSGLHSYKSTGEGADETKTIMQRLRSSAADNAKAFAASQGWDEEQTEAYVKSIDELVSGIPGALKGGVVGLALSGVLGSAVGLIGGFALTNKETREFIFGKPYKDPDGGHHMVGGIFGGITNKLVETADDIKYNFLDAFKDVPKNIKNAFQHFVDRLTGEDNDSILGGLKKFVDQITKNEGKSFIGKILGGVKNTAQQVAEGASDIALDAVTIGSKLAFKAATVPFNLFANIIGGKSYRDEKSAEVKAIKSKRMRDLYEELLANNEAAGIKSFSVLPMMDAAKKVSDAVKLHFDYKALDNQYREFGDRSLFGKLTTNIDEIPLFKKLNEYFTDFMPNAIRGLGGTLLGGILTLTGNPMIGAAVITASMANTAAKSIFGNSILGLFATGVKRLGLRSKRVFKKPITAVKNKLHFFKEALGIHDNKFYIDQLNDSDEAEKADILGELGFTDKEQESYYSLLEKPRARTAAEDDLFNRIDSRINSGLTAEEEAELNTLNQKGKLTGKEKARRLELIGKQRNFFAKFGSTKDISGILKRNASIGAEGRKVRTDYRNNLYADYEPYLKSIGGIYGEDSTEGKIRRRESADYLEKQRKSIYNWVKTHGGEVTDANRANVEEMIQRKLGKSGASMQSIQNEELNRFLQYGKHSKEAEEIDTAFKAKVTTLTTGILNVLKAIGSKLGVSDSADKGSIGHGLKNDNIILDVKEMTTEKMQEVKEMFNAKSGVLDNLVSNGNDTKDKLEDIQKRINDISGDVNGSNNFSLNAPGVDSGIGEASELIEAFQQDPGGMIEAFASTAGGGFATGALNIDRDGMYKLHKGEAVLDSETAKVFRGNFGSGSVTGGISSIFESMSNKLGGLLNVFAGNKSGNDEEKMSFLDKMKASVANVGENISGTIMGSGLIPLKANGQIDIAKIVTRLTALVGGIILLGPTIGKLVDKIKPYIEPIFEAITGKIGDVISNIPNIASDILSGISSKIKASLGLDENAGFFDVWGSLWQKQGQKWFDWLHKDIMEVTQGNDSLLEYMKKRDGETKELTDVYTNEYEALREAAKHDTNAYNTFRNRYGDKVDIDTAQSDLDSAYEKDRAMAEYEANNNPKSTTRRDAFKQKYGVDWSQGKTFEEAKASQKTGLKQGYIGECSKYFEAVNSFGKTFDLDFMDDAPSSYYYNLYKVLTYAELSYLRAAFDNKKNPVTTNLGRLFIKVIRDTTGGKFVSGLTCSTDGQNTFDASLSKFSDSAAADIQEACNRMQARSTAIHSYIEYYNQHKVGEAIQKNYKYDNKYNLDMAEKHVTTSTDFWGAHSQFNTDFYTPEELANHGEDIYYGYMQNDPRWSRQAYGSFKNGRGSTLGAGGCGPTAMANVYTNLTGRNMNPAQMARFSQSNGYNAQGGTSAGLFTAGARKLGLASNAISKSVGSIRNSIKSGNNVIIAGKNGPYTRSGHIMSVRGYDSKGNAIVDDPLKRGARRIPMKKLTKGMTHAWSIGRGPAIGYGELYAPNGEGDWYSTWWDDPDVPATGTSYDPNGGAFGYTLNNGCVYISNINGYLNSVMRKLGYDNFTDLITAYDFSPRRLAKLYPNSRDGEQINYDNTFSALDEIFGVDFSSKINRLPYYPVSNGHYTPEELYELLYTNLKAGNPIAFSSNKGDIEKWRNIIIGKDYYAAGGRTDQHSVLLAGIQTDADGKEYLVVDNPNRMGASFGANNNSTHFYRVDLDYFKNAVLTSNENHEDIKRVTIFPKNSLGPTAYKRVSQDPKDIFNAMKTAASNSDAAYNAFITEFPDGNKYTTYEGWAQTHPYLAATKESTYRKTSPSGSGTGTGLASGNYSQAGGYQSGIGTYSTGGATSTVVTDIRDETNSGTFSEWLSDLVSKFATLGANAIGGFLTGDASSIFKTTKTVYNPGGGSYTASGGYNSGSSGTFSPSNGTAITAQTIIDEKFVDSLLESAADAFHDNAKVNDTIRKLFDDNCTIDYSKYNGEMRNYPYYNNVLNAIANSEHYRKYVSNVSAHIYTWILARHVMKYASIPYDDPANGKNKVTENHTDRDAIKIYNKIKDSDLGFSSTIASQLMGTSINGLAIPTSSLSGYNALPSWAKTPRGEYRLYDMTHVPDYATVHDYTSAVATIGETGTKFPPKNAEELSRMYFRIYEDNGAPSFGRRGFHFNPGNYGLSNTGSYYPGEAIFANLINSGNPSVAEQAQKWYDYISSPSNFHSFPTYPRYTEITGDNDFLSALIQAEDAMNTHLHSEYFKIIHDHSPNITDPRVFVLGGDISGVAPYGVAGRLSGITTLDDAKAVLSAKYGSRVNGVYGMITTGQGNMYGSTWTMPPYPTVSIGNGDAGYNMRDNYQMFADDVYMGDADNPMHVTMDSTPVTSRIDKLIELIDAAVNPKEIPKAGPSDAKSNSIGNGPGISTQPKDKGYSKGVTTVGQKDKLAQLHTKLAKRTRTQINYNHY